VLRIVTITTQCARKALPTLTMQLSRNLFSLRERNFSRKFQEIILAIQIELASLNRRSSTLYANQIYLGHGVYELRCGIAIFISANR